jgi:hypothetical protein
MAKDLKATLNALAEIDAHVEHVILGTKDEPDLTSSRGPSTTFLESFGTSPATKPQSESGSP